MSQRLVESRSISRQKSNRNVAKADSRKASLCVFVGTFREQKSSVRVSPSGGRSARRKGRRAGVWREADEGGNSRRPVST